MSEYSQRYRAFISYSQKDKVFAKRLHKALESFKLPNGKRFGRIFRDDDELGGAASLSHALESAIDSSEDLIAIASPNAVKSAWVNAEVIQYKKLANPKKQVFAVIIDGVPHASNPDEECLVPALKYKVLPDGTVTDIPDEPLAPDARKDSFSKLVTRIVAGLEGVPFDSLWQRQKRRARNQKLLLGAAAIAIAAPLIAWGLTTTNALGRTTTQLASLDPTTQRENFLNGYYDKLIADQRANDTPEEFMLSRDDYDSAISILSAPDLNGDGYQDYFVKLEHIEYCGSSGCRHDLVLTTPEGYDTLHNSVGGDLHILNTSQNGMQDLGLGFGSLQGGANVYDMLRFEDGKYIQAATAICSGAVTYCGLNTIFTDDPVGEVLDMVFYADTKLLRPYVEQDEIQMAGPVYKSVLGAQNSMTNDLTLDTYDEVVGTDPSGEYSLVHIWKGTYGVRKNSDEIIKQNR
ncbi:toll/interleukin-1 receptor domain-containing protein [Hirschia litorea]|uniref:Toll/interleukin-1 receptor domain-containing protein n=1 Tax=Hirschia litorea TaxID=1199156 RepID=A0ABW2IJ44_9PROT